jgi:hypothetical protein
VEFTAKLWPGAGLLIAVPSIHFPDIYINNHPFNETAIIMNNIMKLISPGLLYRSIVSAALVFAVHTNASSQVLDWAKQIGGGQWDEGIGIAVDGSGNVYSVGNFDDTIQFDPGVGTMSLIPAGGKDVFVSKQDTAGNFIWAKRIGSAGYEECTAMAADAQGNIYITGTFLGVADFDPGPATFNLTSSPSTDAFICKLDPSGNLVWAKQFGGGVSQPMPQPVSSNAIAVDDSGNVYTTGIFDGPTDFDPGTGVLTLTPGLTFSSDIFVSKLDSTGALVWARQLGGNAFEGGYGIALDDNGNIFTTGFFNGTVDFDPGPGIYNLTAPVNETVSYLSKLGASGDFVWAKQPGGRTGYSIAADHSGNVYVSGEELNDSITINKFSPSGNNIWARQIGADICWFMTTDGGNSLYLTGQFHGTADFDPGPGTSNMTSIGTSDAYVCKLDSAGNLVWTRQLGGTLDVGGRCVALDASNNLYTTGGFNGTADLDPGAGTYNLTAIASYDIFINKLKPDVLGVGETSVADGMKIYPNPTDGKFVVELNSKYEDATLVLRDVLGQVVDKKTISNSGQEELEIRGANGLYFLEVYQQNGKRDVVRVVKQ